jgi:hypothetical protein
MPFSKVKKFLSFVLKSFNFLVKINKSQPIHLQFFSDKKYLKEKKIVKQRNENVTEMDLPI